jgi:hypothetical protein
MRDSRANIPSVAELPADVGAPQVDAAEASGATAEELIVASHEDLFNEAPPTICDACGETLDATDDAPGYGVPGQGVYLWARGEETRLESVPLCAACASAIGMTALARWEIEEEEG